MLKKKEEGEDITLEKLQQCAKDISSKKDFKASWMWANRFLERYGLKHLIRDCRKTFREEKAELKQKP